MWFKAFIKTAIDYTYHTGRTVWVKSVNDKFVIADADPTHEFHSMTKDQAVQHVKLATNNKNNGPVLAHGKTLKALIDQTL